MPTQPDPFPLELIEEVRMPPLVDAEIRRLLCECFPPDVPVFSQSRHWHGSAPSYSLIHRNGASIVGHVGIVLRRVLIGPLPVAVAGVQNLCTARPLRGSGLGWALMRGAMEEARRRAVPFGLLFCTPNLERFYASLHWYRIDVAVTMEGEQGGRVPIPGKNIGMVLPLGAALFPAGDIDLNGRDW